MKKLKFKLFLLRLFSFLSSVAPLVVTLILRWDKYSCTTAETVKLCGGGLILLIIVLWKVLGKLKAPSRLVAFTAFFLMAYLLKPVVEDIILLSLMALVGELVDFIFFQKAIKDKQMQIEAEVTSDVTVKKMEAVLEKYMGGRT